MEEVEKRARRRWMLRVGDDAAGFKLSVDDEGSLWEIVPVLGERVMRRFNISVRKALVVTEGGGGKSC